MRKFITTCAILTILFFFTSAFNAYDIDTKVNSFAPNFTVFDNGKQVKLSDYRGRFVLVNFWSSENPESRIKNIVYNGFSTENSKLISLVSVNFDKTEGLFDEILKKDKLENKSHYFEQDGKNSEVYKKYHLNSGYSSFLISREGRIIAINPTKQELTKLTCQ